MNNAIKLAIMGAGVIGKRHMDIIGKEPNVDVCAIIDPSDDALVYANSVGVPWFDNLTSMLANMVPDGIIIATPNQYHVSNALEAVSAKIPILLEKPIADHVEDAIKLVEAAENNHVSLLIGHHRRHNPLLQKAKEIITSGKLGNILAAHCMFWVMKPDDYFATPWRRAKGAGPVVVNMIHDIDCLRYLFGEVDSVQAVTTSKIRNFENEENCGAILQFKSGIIATLSISDSITAPWSWDMSAQENAAFPQYPENAYFIGGTHGCLALPSLEYWTYNGERSWLNELARNRFEYQRIDPFIVQLRNFRDVIANVAVPLVSGREGLETLRTTLAVKEAALTAKTIYLN